MIRDSSTLQKGQLLRVEINEVKDRLPQKILDDIRKEPIVELVGYKMVDGNEFGLVVKPVSYTHLTLPTSDLV